MDRQSSAGQGNIEATTMPVVVVNDISKTFEIPGRPPVHALRHVSHRVDKGEVLVVIGPSGSGKSAFFACAQWIAARGQWFNIH